MASQLPQLKCVFEQVQGFQDIEHVVVNVIQQYEFTVWVQGESTVDRHVLKVVETANQHFP